MRPIAIAVLLAAFAAVTAPSARAETAPPRLGLMLDAGVPDGGNVSLVYRPISRVRLNAGVSHNLVGPGVRGGITLAPFTTWFTPTVSGTYGRFFERDANPAARMMLNDPALSSPALERFGYDYADAHLGLEFGRRRLTFFIHGGVTRVWGSVHNLDDAGETDGAQADDGMTVTFTEDPTFTLTTLSARLGLVYYL